MSRARLNYVCAGDLSQQTPAPLLLTRHAQLPNLPAELARRAIPPDETLLLQLPLHDWYTLNPNARQRTVDVLPNLQHQPLPTLVAPANQIPSKSLPPSAAEFTAQAQALLFLVPRAADTRQAVCETPGKSLAVRVDASHGGGPQVPQSDVADLHRVLRTHFTIAPTEAFPFVPDKPLRVLAATPTAAPASAGQHGEVGLNKPTHAGSQDRVATAAERRRAKRSVDQVTAFARAVRERMSKQHLPSVFASVQGGIDLRLRRECGQAACAAFVEFGGVMAGVSIDGLYCGEGGMQRDAVLETVAEVVEAEGNNTRKALRVLTGGSGAPWEVLRAVRRGGIDVIDATFPFEMAESGLATRLVAAVDDGTSGCDSADGRVVNLRDRKWERCSLAVVEECTCFVCRGFSRAYLRHLFEVREMMAVTLLTAHNLWDYLSWFRHLRTAIANGTLDEFERRTVLRR